MALLRGFREIRPEWAPAIDRAVATMEQEWGDRARRAGTAICDLLDEAIRHVEHAPLPEGAVEAAVRASLETSYRDAQRRLEAAARKRVEAIHRHPGLGSDDAELELLASDLFSETTWRLFGLTRLQLLRNASIAGAITGGTVDLAVGGASFFAGAVIGAIGGATLGWFGSDKLASMWSSMNRATRALLPGETGRFLAMGPVSNPRYAWVLLDRALVHYRAVRDRSHARRGPLDLTERGAGIVAALGRDQRDALSQALARLLGDARSGRSDPDTRRALEAGLADVIRSLAPLDG